MLHGHLTSVSPLHISKYSTTPVCQICQPFSSLLSTSYTKVISANDRTISLNRGANKRCAWFHSCDGPDDVDTLRVVGEAEAGVE